MPMRLAGVESALAGTAASTAAIAAAAARAGDGLSFDDDVRGSAAYKLNIARVYVRRALVRAMAASAG